MFSLYSFRPFLKENSKMKAIVATQSKQKSDHHGNEECQMNSAQKAIQTS